MKRTFLLAQCLLLASSALGQQASLQQLTLMAPGATPQTALIPLVEHAIVALPGEDEGPAAALAFFKKMRGPATGKASGYAQEGLYGKAQPVPFTSTKNIIPMTEKLWSREHLIADFKKNKTAGQVAILVVVKTEFCCTNKYRPCAVATAALEKRSTSELKKFRVYGAWIFNEKALPKGADAQAKEKWDAKVAAEYAFEQGPGATLVAIDPATGKGLRTDAAKADLMMDSFEANEGKTPVLENLLKLVLQKFGK